MLFHGPLMQGIESVEGCGERGIAGWVSTSPSISEWIDRPAAQQVADRSAGDRFRLPARGSMDPGERWVPTRFPPESAACGSFSVSFRSKVRGRSSRSTSRAPHARWPRSRSSTASRRLIARLDEFRMRHRRLAQPGVSAQPALIPVFRRLEMSRCRLIHPCHSEPAIAIVGIAGLFPGGETLARVLGQHLAVAVDSTTEVPAGPLADRPRRSVRPADRPGRSRLLDPRRVRPAGTF